MILQPSNNALHVGSISVGPQTQYASKNSNVSSNELASVSFSPSVNIELSSSKTTIAAIPSIYSKPTVYASNESQLQASRVSVSSDALAENAILSKSSDKIASETQEDNSEEKQKEGFGARDKEASASPYEFSAEELQMIEELRARDAEVRAHEQAHKAVGGQYTGSVSYSYQAGPDGKRYAVGGEVPIDVSPISGDPQATIVKMTTVSAAATAPAQPSAQDQMVAAQAARLISEAQSEIAKNRLSEFSNENESKQENEESAPASEEKNDYISSSVDKIQSIAQLGEETASVLDVIA